MKYTNDPVNQRKVSNGDSLVQIYVPPSKNVSESISANSDDDETISVASIDTDEAKSGKDSEKRKCKKVYGRTLSAEPKGIIDAKRKVPPPLGDWCRSQSFPPPQKSVSGDDENEKQEVLRTGKGVFVGRPLSKGVSSPTSSMSEHSDIEGRQAMKCNFVTKN